MKIASYNCNSVRARIDILKKFLLKEKPYVLCIQETKVIDDDFPRQEFADAGYSPVFRGEKSYNGVAILCSGRLDEVRYGFDGEGKDEGTRIISAVFNGITVVNTYVPQGTAPDSDRFLYKLDWFRRLGEFFGAHYTKDTPLIWAGDFNVAPEPIDVHDPKRLLGHVGYHPDEHKALAAVKEWGFTDIFRKHRPEGGHYTFWDYRVKDAVHRGLGWRVDHIWATATLAAKSVDAWIDREPRTWERPSDHTPIIAEFKD